MTATHVLSLHDFLLAFVLPELEGADEALRSEAGRRSPRSGVLTSEELRDQVAKHADRTMTVASHPRLEVITRCRTCPRDEPRPCRALRMLAMPYAQHPAFQPGWALRAEDLQD